MRITGNLRWIERIIVCAAIACGLANGQTSKGYAIVPFAFVANGVQMKPGQVEIKRLFYGVSALRNNKGDAVEFLCGREKHASGMGHLTFDKYGNQYFLREVDEDGGLVSKIPVSPQERDVMQGARSALVHITVQFVVSR